jgi:hypothetical protein
MQEQTNNFACSRLESRSEGDCRGTLVQSRDPGSIRGPIRMRSGFPAGNATDDGEVVAAAWKLTHVRCRLWPRILLSSWQVNAGNASL